MAAVTQQSLNHLLNFSLPPRQAAPAAAPRRSRKPGTGHVIHSQEKFVNAQYRFVMKPSGDYTVHFADPDIFFQWQDILQVIVPRSAALPAVASEDPESAARADDGHTTCPICLAPPTAPRMTKCGHVFCFPCILHYLTTTDTPKWVRCPLCFDSVAARELKSVLWADAPVGAGGELEMRLVQRPSITTLALPRSPTWPAEGAAHRAPFHFLPDVRAFARFMLATPDQLVADLTRELDELAAERALLASMDDALGAVFVDAAEERIRRQIVKATELDTPPLRAAIARAEKDMRDMQALVAKRAALDAGRSRDAAPEGHADDAPTEFLATSSTRAPRVRRNLNPPPPSTSTYFFYQCASGAAVFLHPLDIRVLLAHFGDYASFPASITVRAESVARGGVDDALRKRCKYLAHLPAGADVAFVEADLADVVGPAGLRAFEGALRMRRARRRDKGRKDDRARARAEERERERTGAALDSGAWAAAPARALLSADSVDPPAEEAPLEDDAQEQPAAAPGAWGARSFARVLHAPPPPPTTRTPQRERDEDADADWDGAWHDFQQRADGTGGSGGVGGKRGRKSRLVLLGSGGGGPRRR